MFNLNRIELIGRLGKDPQTVPNGPTTLALATNVAWTDKSGEKHERVEWHQLVVWNKLGTWAASLTKGTPLFATGELVYEEYPRKHQAAAGKQTIEVEIPTRVAKIRVQQLIRLERASDTQEEAQ